MPLVDFDLQETWDSLYEAQADGVAVHYCRAGMRSYYGDDIPMAVRAFGLEPGARVLIVGAGFGYGAKQIDAIGFAVTAVDTSPWIQANAAANADFSVAALDVLNDADRKALGTFDWCLTEDVLPALADDKAASLAAVCRMMAANVGHVISVGDPRLCDVRLNWKGLAAWKALVSPDLVCQRGSAVML